MIQARELSIDGGTSVTDLFQLMDMPYKITNKARVVLLPDPTIKHEPYSFGRLVLRLEWEVEKGDPEV